METPEAIQARHRKEQRDLQSRITSKKKNATKKTRKGVNDECATLERELKQRQEQELAALNGDRDGNLDGQGEEEDEEPNGIRKDAAGKNTEGADSTEVETSGITNLLKDTVISSGAPTQTQSSQPYSQARPRTPEPTARPQAQGQGEGQGGGGKKRNRQKERMARRAAERETAAEAAAQEAQGMTDHRGLERSALERAFSAHGLVEHEIRPDGHCLFSAVADQLAQRKIPISPAPSPSLPNGTTVSSSGGGEGEAAAPYKVVRRAATDYMESHADDFAPFLEEPLASYVPKIRDTAEWGGQLELLALASAYRVEIRVVQDGRTETVRPGGGAGVEGEGDRTIWLAYYRHGYGLGEHYNSLRKG
ncbi:OTU domain-containing protein 6B [Nemania diffusa]|nr:OTU domain-containing protein 6B [Nemania diffusa]